LISFLPAMPFIKKHGFALFAGIIFLLIFTVENINGRFWLNDFKVYYEAAKAFINNTPVYGVLFALGSGYFKYSPFTLLLFVPYCIFTFEAARIIHYALLSLSIISLFLLTGHLINKYFFNNGIKKINLWLMVAFICTISHLVRELHLGNINVGLLLLIIASLYLIFQSRAIAAGILLGLVVITKPFFALLFLPLLFRKKIKVIIIAVAAILIFSIIPAFFTGWPGNITLQKEWIHTMLEHNASFPSNNTIESLLKIYFGTIVTVGFQYGLMLAVVAGYLLLFYKNKAAESKSVSSTNAVASGFLMECMLILAIIPNIFKTDTQHFILSLPLIIFLLYYFSKEKNYVLILIFIVTIVLYGGNSSDLVGKNMAQIMDNAGLLGVANLLLFAASLYAYNKLKRNEAQ
jgi:hypothetical protein